MKAADILFLLAVTWFAFLCAALVWAFFWL
jgi:hypothetical protein